MTRKDLRAVEVAAIGDGFERLCLQNSLRLLGDIGKLCSIGATVRHLVRYDQMMLGFHCHLDVVADDARSAPARGHRGTVGTVREIC